MYEWSSHPTKYILWVSAHLDQKEWRCTVSHNKTHRFLWNIIYKIGPITASTYPKNQKINFKISHRNEKFSFSYNFDYIAQHETSLLLMLMSMVIYNIHCSQLSHMSIIVFIHSPLWFQLEINILKRYTKYNNN